MLEYLKDLNGTQAAIRAGYSAKTAAVIASENLTKPNLAAAITEAQAKRAKESEIDAAWVVERLKRNAERAAQAEPVRDAEGRPTGEYTYQGSVVNAALGLIGKHLGMFVDRSEVTGKNGAPLIPPTSRPNLQHLSTEQLEQLATLTALIAPDSDPGSPEAAA